MSDQADNQGSPDSSHLPLRELSLFKRLKFEMKRRVEAPVLPEPRSYFIIADHIVKNQSDRARLFGHEGGSYSTPSTLIIVRRTGG